MNGSRPAGRTRGSPWSGMVALLLAGLGACAPAPPPDAGPRDAPLAPRPEASEKARAHAALAARLRPFPITRGPPPRAPMAADDERFRLGAFWRVRTDTARFGAGFRRQADAVLALPGASPADDALRALLDVVDARLPDWQALVDYNASGRMREDGGEDGRRHLPGAIAALDAIEAAVWRYLDTAAAVDTDTNVRG